MMKDLSVLQDAPFTDKGSVVEIFTDLSVWAGIRKVIESINMKEPSAASKDSPITFISYIKYIRTIKIAEAGSLCTRQGFATNQIGAHYAFKRVLRSQPAATE